ncbi:hypothetical protein [Streptomyces sp. NRRL B-24484]|uniref:hypothetical protein n=1 Tax=Streptomyces sp. NRRL B-24484 TaxID=1463833 RepID=UPI0004BEBF4A|nr:hypothetical protein [Streptomyces sp. NRRL B-24484]
MHDREWVLRHAALLDRAALPAVAPAGAGSGAVAGPGGGPNPAAVGAAMQLRQMDRHGGTGRGPLGPDAPEWDGQDGAIGYLRQEYLAWRSGQLSDLAAVGAAMRAMSEVTDDNVRSGQAAGRGEPWPREQLIDLARRRVAAYAKAVDYGIDAVADQQRADQQLRELEAAGGSARP